MKQFNMYFNQISNFCIWLNTNTKINASMIYDGDSIHVELTSNSEALYTHHIDGLLVKTENIINLDMNRLVQFLLVIKIEQEDLNNVKNDSK